MLLIAVVSCLFALKFSGYPIATSGANDNVGVGGFDPNFNFYVVNAIRWVIRRIKA
jgi:hypothetical protein